MNDFIKKHSGRAGETGQIWSDTDERLDSETRLYGTLPISGRHERERERERRTQNNQLLFRNCYQ